MSREAALQFIARAGADSALGKRLAGLKGRTAIEALCAIAAEQGYSFNEEDYRAAVVALAEGELDEEALEEVRRQLGVGGSALPNQEH